MVKFKFVNKEFYDDFKEDYDSFKIVENPIGYDNLPEGEYLIRGNKKSHAKKYWHCFDVWYLIENRTVDNGHFICDCTEYKLYPQMSEKQWDVLSHVPYKCLSPVWRRYLSGYQFGMELRELTRNIKKDFLK